MAAVVDSRTKLTNPLEEHGALLLRGFEELGASGLERLVEAVSGRAIEYTDRAARRSRIEGRVYTATDYPAAREIFLHNESTYAARFPRKLFLHCRRPAETGGRTPIADVRAVLRRIDPALRAEFSRKGVLYVRNFGNGVFSPTWQEAFQTDDRSAMEAYCRKSGIDFEWVGPDHVRTRQRRPAIARHPGTGESVWFNHAATLHVSTLAPRVRARIEKLFARDDLPTNTYLGDGSQIPADALEQIRSAYRHETVCFEWQPGDVLVLDNLLVAHGRESFTGPRDVIVAMSETTSWDEVAAADG